MPATAAIATVAVVGLAAAWPALWWLQVRALEKPAFTVLRTLGPRSEVRAYAPYIIAEAEVPDERTGGKMRNAMNEGFRSVAGFIFGGNERRESVAMTSPVRTERVGGSGGSEKIAMTSPVRTERADGGAYKVSFVMPRKFKLDTLPVPRDTRVHLSEVPAHVAGAIWFYGSVANAEAMEQKSAELREQLRSAGLTPEGQPLLYNYYPPFAPSWMRHTEVLYRLKESAEEVTANAQPAAKSTQR